MRAIIRDSDGINAASQTSTISRKKSTDASLSLSVKRRKPIRNLAWCGNPPLKEHQWRLQQLPPHL
jgi:hypothetical protein